MTTQTTTKPIDPRSEPTFYSRGTQRSRARAIARYYDALIAWQASQ